MRARAGLATRKWALDTKWVAMRARAGHLAPARSERKRRTLWVDRTSPHGRLAVEPTAELVWPRSSWVPCGTGLRFTKGNYVRTPS